MCGARCGHFVAPRCRCLAPSADAGVVRQDRFGKAKGKLTLSGDSTVKVMDRRAMLVLEPKKKLRPRKRVIRIRFKQVGGVLAHRRGRCRAAVH